LIPFINMNIDDGAVLASEVIKVLSIKDPNKANEPQPLTYSGVKGGKDVEMGKSQSL